MKRLTLDDMTLHYKHFYVEFSYSKFHFIPLQLIVMNIISGTQEE